MFCLEKAVSLLDTFPDDDLSEKEGDGEHSVSATIAIPIVHANEATEYTMLFKDIVNKTMKYSDKDDKQENDEDDEEAHEEENDATYVTAETDQSDSPELDPEIQVDNTVLPDISIPLSHTIEVEVSQKQQEPIAARGRKRKRDTASWMKNIRKRRRQGGLDYKSVKGLSIPRRSIKEHKDCHQTCKFKCSQKIEKTEREKIFKSFWELSDTEKGTFFCRTIDHNNVKRRRSQSERKCFSLAYHLIVSETKIRVCKPFYLNTLDISQRRVQYFFDRKTDSTTGTPTAEDLRGSKTTKRISEDLRQGVKIHIKSFPTVEAHYCRASSSRQYLDQSLSVSKMHRLYVVQCQDEGHQFVKRNIYSDIFNSEFNLGFLKPKKDQCDKCVMFAIQQKNGLLDEESRMDYMKHYESKLETKEERDNDRKSKDVVVCFDLENVITLPKANVSNFYYKRKLSLFNLTVHNSLDGQGYCAIWTENIAGRGANEIASALISVLKRIAQEHRPDKVILWSDSCVPQNRNSAISFALKDLMAEYQINTIIQKFCTPGHSCIQEVDNIHSMIEKSMRHTDVFSPLGFVRCLMSAMVKRPLEVIQLREHHFYQYLEAARHLNFTEVPYSKVKELSYDGLYPFSMKYRLSFGTPMAEVNIRPRDHRRRMSSSPRSPTDIGWPSVQRVKQLPVLPKVKVDDIKSMLKFMPPTDSTFLKGLLQNNRGLQKQPTATTTNDKSRDKTGEPNPKKKK